MPRLRRFYDANHLHYVTTSTYRRTRVFDSDRFKRKFTTSLADLRTELGFRIIGYVLMPEHCHLLLWPSESANPSQIMQRLEERVAKFILRNLHHNCEFAWCRRMLDGFRLPPTVHHHAHYRVWQRRFYDFNVWTDRKIREKLDYMHNNPVEPCLVERSGGEAGRLGVVELAFLLSAGQFSSGHGPDAVAANMARYVVGSYRRQDAFLFCRGPSAMRSVSQTSDSDVCATPWLSRDRKPMAQPIEVC